MASHSDDRSDEYPHVFAYFVLQLSPVPLANEIDWWGPAHTRMRDDTFEAAGVPGGDPNPRLVQARRVRPGQQQRQERRGREPPRAEREEGILPAGGLELEEDP